MEKLTDIVLVCPRCKPGPGSKCDTNVPCSREDCEARPIKVPKRIFTRAQVKSLLQDTWDEAVREFSNSYSENNDVESIKSFKKWLKENL